MHYTHACNLNDLLSKSISTVYSENKYIGTSVCWYVYVCVAFTYHSSNLETLIKCYYQHNGFHLLSFYYESFAFVCLYVWVCE